MNCYGCEHDKGSHLRGRGKCNKPECPCDAFERDPYQNDEPGAWLGHDDDAWKKASET